MLAAFITQALTLWGAHATPSSSRRLLDQIRLTCQRRHSSLRTAISVEEVKRVFSYMSGTPKLMAELIYGTGMCGRRAFGRP